MGVHTLYRLRAGNRPRRGLTYRIVLMGILMAVFKIATFALLFVAILGLRDARTVASRSEAVLASANRVEKLVVDLETGLRGAILTHDQRFLRSWNAARAAFPREEATLQRLSAGQDADQAGRAREIAQAADSYVRDYAVPLMATERQDPAAARARVVSGEGERRLTPLRDKVAAFADAQRGIAAAKERSSIGAARTATITAAVAALGSLVLIFFFLVYLIRVIVGPVRRASMMAGELAAGDLSGRMPETSPGEIGVLESEFNTMAGSLEAGHDKLRRVAEEQSALRRVATLVAQGVAPSVVFAAVAEELGRLLGADHTHLVRLEPDDTVTVVGCWSDPGVPEIAPPLGEQWPVEYGTVVASVLRIGQPTRMTDYAGVTGEIGSWVRSHGIRHVVGCPVSVEGRIWGAMIIFSHEAEPPPGVTEDRMLDFVKFVSTAIANAQGRSELLASRARVVAASDESRRRIERNLHDGAQQQLVSLGLRLRAVEAAVPPSQARLRRELSSTVQSLSAILADLHEISRGLDPSILTRNGLRPALKSLARRSALPVDLDVQVDRRLPERVEVAMYYTVSEALTNVAKYAHASEVDIDLRLEDEVARLSVHDDGVGGAHFGGGSGLVGLRDRVEALGGGIHVVSPSGGGTSLIVDIPVRDA